MKLLTIIIGQNSFKLIAFADLCLGERVVQYVYPLYFCVHVYVFICVCGYGGCECVCVSCAFVCVCLGLYVRLYVCI